MKRIPALLMLVWLALFCSKGATGDKIVARVNGSVIHASELAHILPAQPDSQLEQTKAKMLEQMINQQLFVLRAEQLGYQETLAGALEKKKADLLKTTLNQYARDLKPTKQDVARESLNFVTDVHLKLMEVATWDTVKMIQLLLQQGVPFESLAVRYSRTQAGGPDGDLGFSPMSRLPPEILRAVAALKPGETAFLVTRAIFYDFVKLVETRGSPAADTLSRRHDQIVASARQRKSAEFMLGIQDRVQFDEGVLDYMTRFPDSLKPQDMDRVVAYRKDGYKTRIKALLPLQQKYGEVFPSVRRRALKEDVESDFLEQEAKKLKLDRTADFKQQWLRLSEGGIYQYFYNREVNPYAQPSDSEIAAYFRAHPEVYAGELTPKVAGEIKTLLIPEKQRRRYQELVQELRARAKISIDSKVLQSIRPVSSKGPGENK